MDRAGSIDSTGLFVADTTSGEVVITATDTVTQLQAQALVRVAAEAPFLARIEVRPDSVLLRPGQTQLFTASGFNQFGFLFDFAPQWSATGGTIDDTGFFSAGSEIGSFTVTASDTSGQVIAQAAVRIAALPQQIVLLNPADNGVVGNDTLEFRWQQSAAEVSRYWIEVATDSLFSDALIDSTVADTTYTFSNLEADKEYFWRVRAFNIAGYGPFSEPRKFSLVVTAVLSNDPGVPTEYKLFQNYPNPFNPTTTIRFHVKEPIKVVLKIYDLSGREVLTLVDEDHDPGQYNVVFDADRFASGLYFYKIQMGDFKTTKKMVLLK